MYFDRAVIINPKLVKAHYMLSTDSYKGNKKRAVSWAKKFVESNPFIFADGVVAKFGVSKQDDMADALIMLLYYLDTYSNQLTPSTYSLYAERLQ